MIAVARQRGWVYGIDRLYECIVQCEYYSSRIVGSPLHELLESQSQIETEWCCASFNLQHDGSHDTSSCCFNLIYKASNALNSIDTLQNFCRTTVVAGLLQRAGWWYQITGYAVLWNFNDCEFSVSTATLLVIPNMVIGVINQPNNDRRGAMDDFNCLTIGGLPGVHPSYV